MGLLLPAIDKAILSRAVALVAVPKNREYMLWKWWEWNYFDRKNYKELTLLLTAALYADSMPATPRRS